MAALLVGTFRGFLGGTGGGDAGTFAADFCPSRVPTGAACIGVFMGGERMFGQPIGLFGEGDGTQRLALGTIGDDDECGGGISDWFFHE